jgi:hypothetical protein
VAGAGQTLRGVWPFFLPAALDLLMALASFAADRAAIERVRWRAYPRTLMRLDSTSMVCCA